MALRPSLNPQLPHDQVTIGLTVRLFMDHIKLFFLSASSITSTLGNPAVNSPALALPTTPILGAAATISSLVAPVTTLAGLTAATLSIPAIIVPSVGIVGVPSECLLLKNMFDPNSEVVMKNQT